MDLGITDKVALVTGASSGLGFAVAKSLSNEGARVALAARDAERTRDAAARIGRCAKAFTCDLANPTEREALTDDVHREVGPIDILVLNGGGPPFAPFESTTDEQFVGAFDQLLWPALTLVRGVLPGMRARGWGRILFVGSCYTKQPGRGMILSNTARAAVVAFAKTFAIEAAADGVSVNTLMPGFTATERLESLAHQIASRNRRTVPDVMADWTRNIPAGRVGTPEEFAAMATFLCSSAASYVTGTAISVDGGWNGSLF